LGKGVEPPCSFFTGKLLRQTYWNVIIKARKHFDGLKVAIPSLKGFALIDQTSVNLETGRDLAEKMWQRREIENYLLHPTAIKRLSTKLVTGEMELFEQAQPKGRRAFAKKDDDRRL